MVRYFWDSVLFYPIFYQSKKGKWGTHILTNITNGNKFIWQEKYNRRFKFRNKQPYWAILKKKQTSGVEGMKTMQHFHKWSRKKHVEFLGILDSDPKILKGCKILQSFQGWSFVFSGISKGKVRNLKIPRVFPKKHVLNALVFFWIAHYRIITSSFINNSEI